MIPNPFKAKDIHFEGIDGSGKSEQYTRAKNYMDAFHPKVSVRYTKEPDRNRPVGKIIYDILEGIHPDLKLSDLLPHEMQSYYVEDRITNHRTNVLDALLHMTHVFEDRGMASSISYGAKNSAEFKAYIELHERMFSAAQVPFIQPDLILIYDVPVEVAIQRMVSSGKKLDKFETSEFLTKVRDNYLKFAKIYPNCVIINAEAPAQEVFVQTKENLSSVLSLKG